MQIVKFPLEVTLKKTGEMVYFSQIDLIHILERALRRSGLPLFFTQGFNPHVKISFKNGLKLGREGNVETVFYFTSPISLQKLAEKLTPQLPQGLEIIDTKISG